LQVCGAPMLPARLPFAARWRQHQSLVPVGAAGTDRSGILLDPLAQAVGELGTCEQAVTQRNGSVEVSSLRPATGGTEAMDQRFLNQALRLTDGAQPFFDLGGLGKLLGCGFILLLLAQQLSFQTTAHAAPQAAHSVTGRSCTAIGCTGTLSELHHSRNLRRISPAWATSRARTIRFASITSASPRKRSMTKGTKAIAPMRWSRVISSKWYSSRAIPTALPPPRPALTEL
jgi:hypothetical protein